MAKLNLTIPTLDLPDGNPIPMLGYGSGTAWFKKSGDSAQDQALVEAVKTALKVGYIHLDTAEAYGTEAEVGTAIKASGIARDKLFVTTKVMANVNDIPNGINASLKKLGLDYVDLYLIHAPYFGREDEKVMQDAWANMEEVAATGKAKSIGVSNFYRQDIEVILKTCKVRPAINQIEFHPYLQHGDLLPYLKNQGIRVAAFGPLTPVNKAHGGPLDPILESLAKKYAVNPGEILLRWCVDQNVVPITTSNKEQRLSDMLRIFTFKLTPKELEQITETGNSHHFRAFWKDKFAADDRT